jgi:uncharacterized protein YjdB
LKASKPTYYSDSSNNDSKYIVNIVDDSIGKIQGIKVNTSEITATMDSGSPIDLIPLDIAEMLESRGIIKIYEEQRDINI